LALFPLPLAVLFLLDSLLLPLAAGLLAALGLFNTLLALLFTLALLLLPLLPLLLALEDPGLNGHKEFEIPDLNLLALECQQLLVESLPNVVLRLPNVSYLSSQSVAIGVYLIKSLLDRLSILSDLILSLLEGIDALAEIRLFLFELLQPLAHLILFVLLL